MNSLFKIDDCVYCVALGNFIRHLSICIISEILLYNQEQKIIANSYNDLEAILFCFEMMLKEFFDLFKNNFFDCLYSLYFLILR